ncbi:MAG: HU family DNA-binding protein [Bacteroides sp.]|nr:HU family DNA-binding protein [Bacteroides sp.]MCM1379803.1 HU family DNA-binding protein [Bacteroides sp.]MCM1446162.1 HU family DNA-binding protein [Prevotella sp.]
MSITAELSKRVGRDRKSTETLIDALNKAILQHCGELDTVAIPSFGNFEPIKHEEQIITDRSTGHRILLPPEIQMVFKPAGKLRKLVDKQEDE